MMRSLIDRFMTRRRFATTQIVLCAAMVARTASAAVPCGKSEEAFYPVATIKGETTINGLDIKITVDSPDVSEITKCSISPFEYGTAVYFTVSEDHPVRVTIAVESPLSFRRTIRTFETKYLSLEPTLLAAQREKWPHYFDIRDKQGRMIYHLYLDHDGNVAKTKAWPMSN
jgi:hypothetical protein